jgi:HAD superfamily hydrolase (TIGR01549 family)
MITPITPSTPITSASAPKAILFDLDDTLWPIVPVIVRAEVLLHDWFALHAPNVAQQFSIAALREQRMALLEQQPALQLDLHQLRRICLHSAFGIAGEDSAKIDAAMDYFVTARNAVTPYADVLPGLQRLKGYMQGRMLVGSISNGNADLASIGMAHHFTVSLAAATFGSAKPDAAIFHAACEQLGVAPHDAVYVGDDLKYDVRGAQNAGMRAVWLKRGDTRAQQQGDIVPDAICATFDELLVWLDSHSEE